MDRLYCIPWKNIRKSNGSGSVRKAALLLMFLFPFLTVGGQTSQLVYPDGNGKLIYSTYANRGEEAAVNIIPDFSFAGYMGGGVSLPDNIPVKITLEPSGAEDDRTMIQDAINQVSLLTPDEDGFRGAILLKKGLYKVNGPLEIKSAGVVLQGEGQLPAINGGTEIVATASYKHSFLNISGYVEQISENSLNNDNWSEETRTWNNTFNNTNQSKRIITSYVGTGSRRFVLEDASAFVPGDKILVRRTPNQLWVDTLEMSTLSQSDPEDTDWTPESYTIDHPRTITEVKGDTISIDIPIVDPMQDLYGGGEVLIDPSIFPVQQVGIENMFITSEYKSYGDEDHGWDAILILNSKNCWVRNVTARHFGYSCVYLQKRTSFCTVQDCAMLDPKSLTTGGRKYSFPISSGGVGNLVQRCYSRGGRHCFVTHSRVTGPHVFLDCYATDTHADIGPHHRWAAGILFDNVYGGQIRVRNRWNSGTGHGWAGVQTMFWNCHSYKSNFKVESPLGGLNWGIGCTANLKEGNGFWDSYGTPVTPRSLYLQQLKDRLGQQGIDNVATGDQQNNRIWDYLADWAGNHSTGIRDASEYLESISVYPVPAEREISFDLTALTGKAVDVELIDMLGRIHYRERMTGGTIWQISIPEGLSQQVVMVKFNVAHQVRTQKILIN